MLSLNYLSINNNKLRQKLNFSSDFTGVFAKKLKN